MNSNTLSRIIVCFITCFFVQVGSSQLVINEVMPSNNTTIQDEAGQYDDWFEIYNGGSSAVDLQGFYLTDDFNNQDKFLITSSLVIQQGEYLIFWADEDQSQGPTHTNFKLSASGEEIMLTAPNGVTVIDSFTIPTVPEDLSFGRISDGNANLQILTPASPGASNNASSGLTQPPTISLASGHYNNAQTVTISAQPNATIYFTTDGSIPTPSSQVYTGPITISSTGSLRAIALRPGFDESFVVTHSYVVNFNTDLPIFFITMNPDDLYGDQEGIYVEGTNGIIAYCENTAKNYNQDWEREGHLKVFVDGNVVTENNIGVNIGGNCKRRRPQKPLNLRFRDEYSDTGDNEFKYKIFPDNDLDEFKRLILRDGNNDIDEFFKDATIARLVRPEFDLDATSAQPAIVFLNGDYIGIQILREKWDRWHLSNDHEKVQDRDSIDMIRNPGRIEVGNRFWALERASDGDTESWHEFLVDVRSRDMSIESEYQGLKDQIDYNELINFLTTEHFFGNRDWVPNNQRVWKEKGEGRKWRWALTDLDGSMKENVDFNNLADRMLRYPNGNPNDGSNIVFMQMFEHQEFRHEYIQRMNTYIQLVFTNAKYDAVIDGLYNEVLPDLPMANQLFGYSLSQYATEIANQKNWIAQRAPFVRDHMESQWNMSSNTFNLTLNFDANSNGKVALHSNYFELPANYQATYHDNILIDIHAIPDQGYRFSHWQETGNTNAHLYTSFTSNTTLTPVFVPAQDLVINEIHYNPNGSSEAAEFIEIYNPDSNAKPLHFFEFGEGICFEFPEGATIGPGEYVVIANDASIYQGNGYQVFEYEFSNLDNDGEHLSLINRNNQVIDSLTYNDGGDWIGVADGGFYSLALLDHTLDNALAASWDVQSVFVTPGAANQFLPFDTFHLPSDIVINEIHYHPFDSITPSGDTIVSRNYEFIELKNISNTTISLNGVAFTRGVTYEFPNGSMIPPNGYVVIAEDSLLFFERYNFYPMGVYSGKLSNSGEMIWLSDDEGKLLDAVRYDDMFPWDTEADGGFNDFSLALIDATKPNDTHINWSRQCTALQTPLQDNDFGCFTGQNAAGLVINEIHYQPTGGVNNEYLELFNSATTIIQLEGMTFSHGVSFTFGNLTLFPGTYVIIARDSSSFHNTYGFAPDGDYVGALANGGETIRLKDFFDNLIDEVTYDELAPWATEASQGAHSLALIDHTLDNNLASSWCIQNNNITPKAANSFDDADNDGIADCIDNCSALDDSLIGTACDDSDVCTTGEKWDNNCNCTGGVFIDSDSDGVCDALDQCIGIDDGLIGTACDDGDPCTSGETFNSNCQCAGGIGTDSDNDGICDGLDQCPGFDDDLIGQVCDDSDACTPLTVNSDCGCAPVENAALNGTASMISQLSNFVPSRLIDGVTNNNTNSGLAQTEGLTTNDWVQIDLGSNIFISTVAIHNRTSCCSDRLNNVYVMVADSPFPTNANVNQAINNADFIHQLGDESDGAITGVNINLNGRYVRLQKSGNNVTNAINLKEIEVFTPYTIQDSDNDGVCDLDDVCSGFDDNLIGTSCDDNDPCTTNDLYTNNCNCVGTAVGDSDGDGVCNAVDQCPNFDDNLIGQPCDDGILCFSGSTWDNNCNCTGGQFFDTDNDNVCDNLDQCPGFDDSMDVNNNGIPDGCEGCEDMIVENNQSPVTTNKAANISIETNGTVQNGLNISYKAGQEIEMKEHFEVKAGAVYHAFIATCNQ